MVWELWLEGGVVGKRRMAEGGRGFVVGWEGQRGGGKWGLSLLGRLVGFKWVALGKPAMTALSPS